MNENFYDYIHKDDSFEEKNQINHLSNLDIRKIDEINSLLSLRGHPIIDLTNISNLNLNFFIDLIRNIQEENEKIISNNIEIKQKLIRSDDEISNLKSKNNSFNQEKKLLEDKILDLKNQKKFIDSNFKSQANEFELEKEELNKIIVRITSKENAFRNEINKLKKEQLTYIDKIKFLQEKVDNLSIQINNTNPNKLSKNTMNNISNNSNLFLSKIGNFNIKFICRKEIKKKNLKIT